MMTRSISGLLKEAKATKRKVQDLVKKATTEEAAKRLKFREECADITVAFCEDVIRKLG